MIFTLWKVGPEEADVAEGDPNDPLDELFALCRRVDVDWELAHLPLVQLGHRPRRFDPLRSCCHLL